MPHLGLSNQEVEEKYPSLEAVDDLELNDLARLEDDSLYAAGMRVVQDILHEMAVAGRTRHVLSSKTATTTTTTITTTTTPGGPSATTAEDNGATQQKQKETALPPQPGGGVFGKRAF